MPVDLAVAVDRPFPGLLPFEAEQSLLFFGREQHTAELLRRLSSNRFLAVVGTSGSGKSSLVRAGLLPALFRGYLTGSTTHWRIAVMKPGGAPIENLCDALNQDEALGPDPDGSRLELLRSSSLGLVEVVRAAELRSGESLLVVADQFEELFRYSDAAETGDEASLFVSLLLQAADRFDAPIYIVLTMRSDFLGDCARFTGLPEALSRSQFLIPRLTRQQRQEAIERPLQLAGAAISPALVQQLLNDSADDATALAAQNFARSGRPDPLPVLQHALMRTFAHAKKSASGPIELVHYREVGGIESALDQHADSIFKTLDPAGQVWAEKIFRCITTTENGRQVRRPTRRTKLYAVVGAETEKQQAEVNDVLARFLDRREALLVMNKQGDIDIPHESLIWKWRRLHDWVAAEAACAACYLEAVKDAEGFKTGQCALWRDPQLRDTTALARRQGWNAAWGAQYEPSGEAVFAEVQKFLRKSTVQQRMDRWTWRVAVVAIVAALAIAAVLWQKNQDESARRQFAEQAAAQAAAEARRSQQEVQRFSAELAGKEELLKGRLTPEERARIEKEREELKKTLAESTVANEKLRNVAKEAAGLAAAGGDLKALNQTLEKQLEQARSRLEQVTAQANKLEKDLGSEQTKSKGLAEALSVANAELLRLKNPIKEQAPEAVKPAAPVVEQNKQQAAIRPLPQCPGRINEKDGQCYVKIPAGTFMMGCSQGDSECQPHEKPIHQVNISRDFWMGRTEVTEAAYNRSLGKPGGSETLPQVTVNWMQARAYCEWAGMRLPTEAEWEYAARTGGEARRYGPVDEIAWHRGNSGSQVHPVGQKQRNAWGLYDMLGNVWEWVGDWYDEVYYRKSPSTDPSGPRSGKLRVVRGASWGDYPEYVRASNRNRFEPTLQNLYLGFRCAGELR